MEREREDWLIIAAEYHRRVALPMACGLFALVAAPLGILMSRGRHGVLFTVGLAVVGGYYLCHFMGTDLAFKGVVAPWAGIWLPNGLTLGIAVFLNYLASRHH